jgi:hypothetical protein
MADSQLVPWSHLANLTQVSMHENLGWAIDSSGKLLCWGGNTYKETGQFEGSAPRIVKPRQVRPVRNVGAVRQVAVGQTEVCFVLWSGELTCIGRCSLATCGLGGRFPNKVFPMANAVNLTTDGRTAEKVVFHIDGAAVLLSGGKVRTFGGQFTLGIGTTPVVIGQYVGDDEDPAVLGS